MRLIVEDGTCPTGANVYASTKDADDYHSARGNTAWGEAMAEAKEAALIRATDFLNALVWKGRKVYGGSAVRQMAWPRYDMVIEEYEVDIDEIPPAVVQACCEAALRELASPGCLQPDLARGGQMTRLKVDVIEMEYEPGASATTVYSAVLAPVRPYLRGRGFEIWRG